MQQYERRTIANRLYLLYMCVHTIEHTQARHTSLPLSTGLYTSPVSDKHLTKEDDSYVNASEILVSITANHYVASNHYINCECYAS